MTTICITRRDGSVRTLTLEDDQVDDMVECWVSNPSNRYLGPWGANCYRRLIDALDPVAVTA